ncbi:DNA methyltransferase [Roseibacillus persicicus]|uniref:DNA methyltransferase n=1 Tax=Roseibacillus persicicus TaxID=454148 RepID=UPI00398B5FAF
MNAGSLAQELEDFKEFGAKTRQLTREFSGVRVPYFVNEFWTSKQRAAHSLHEVSYRACFKPQLPRFFIERLTQIGDLVYDPFMGRGTTLLEAALLDREVAGCDINPLAPILCGPRLEPPLLEEVEARLQQIPFQGNALRTKEELNVFFHPKTLAQLRDLQDYLGGKGLLLDAVDRWIRMVATNRLTGHSSGFFSVYTLPPNQATSLAAQRRINEKRQQSPPVRDVPAIILKKSRALLKKLDRGNDALWRRGRNAQLITASAAATPTLPDSSVDLVVTSPPFLDVVDYNGDNWLRCWFNGFDAAQVPILKLSKPSAWQEAMSEVLTELARVLKPGGFIAFEVGEVRKGVILLEELVVPAGLNAGLHPELVLVNEQEFTKTANCWGVENLGKGTNTNRIVVFSKP